MRDLSSPSLSSVAVPTVPAYTKIMRFAKNCVRFVKIMRGLQKFCEVCKNCVSFVVHLEIDCWSKNLFTVTIVIGSD